MKGRGQRSYSLGQFVHKKLFFIPIMAGEVFHFGPGFFIGQLLKTGKRQRVNLNVVGNHKLHAQQPHATVGQE